MLLNFGREYRCQEKGTTSISVRTDAGKGDTSKEGETGVPFSAPCLPKHTRKQERNWQKHDAIGMKVWSWQRKSGRGWKRSASVGSGSPKPSSKNPLLPYTGTTCTSISIPCSQEPTWLRSTTKHCRIFAFPFWRPEIRMDRDCLQRPWQRCSASWNRLGNLLCSAALLSATLRTVWTSGRKPSRSGCSVKRNGKCCTPIWTEAKTAVISAYGSVSLPDCVWGNCAPSPGTIYRWRKRNSTCVIPYSVSTTKEETAARPRLWLRPPKANVLSAPFPWPINSAPLSRRHGGRELIFWRVTRKSIWSHVPCRTASSRCWQPLV